MDSCIKFPVENHVLQELAKNAQEYALTNGFVMRLDKFCTDETVVFAPFTFVPSPFPRKEFLKAKDIQKDINEVLHKVANDHEFLKNSLRSTVKGDEFTANIFNIYETVLEEGLSQPFSLGLIRTDYLLHQSAATDAKDSIIKQVESNTISSSLGGLTAVAGDIHRYILNRLGHRDKAESLPLNNALDCLADGLVAAWKLYNVPSAVLLFLVEKITVNVGDQRKLEFAVFEKENYAKVIRRTFQDVSERAHLEGSALFIDGYEVAVVYFRDGYMPEHYKNEKIWEASLMMERSLAIKCPSAGYHLAGCKKIQQVLAQDGVLERFLVDPDRVQRVRETFAAMHSLDETEGGKEAMFKAMSKPEKYVLKPQREGGGNNFYGSDVHDKLKELCCQQEQAAYILMERIIPPETKNIIIRPGKEPEETSVVSELGIYGVVLGSKDKIIINKEGGHLLRTKVATSNEGGVARGFGCLDSPFLI